MPDNATKVAVKHEGRSAAAPRGGWADWPSFPLFDLRRQMDRLLDDFKSGYMMFPFAPKPFGGEPLRRAEMAPLSFPPMDVAESEKDYRITAELPGMDQKSIELALADDVLTIKGDKKEEHEEKDEDHYLSERRFGSFQRSFQIPSGIDAGRIAAQFANGVLTVTLPKSAEAQTRQRKIEIKAN